MGLFLGSRHKLLCMHVYKDLIQCKLVCEIKLGKDPCPLLARSLSNRCEYLFKRKKYFGVRCTLNKCKSKILSWQEYVYVQIIDYHSGSVRCITDNVPATVNNFSFLFFSLCRKMEIELLGIGTLIHSLV